MGIVAEQPANAISGARLWTRLRAPVSTTTGLLLGGAALAGLSLLLAGPLPGSGPVAPHVFTWLFSRNEPAAAWVAVGVLIAAAILARGIEFPERAVVSRLSRDPKIFIGGVTLVLAASALLIYRAHPLSMDEYAPLFQARVFAHGRLAGQVPPELVPRLVPPIRWFVEASASGAMLSSYFPGFALLLTPFALIGCPWLLNPLIGGATLLIVWRLARRLWPGTDAPGWAVLLTAASPAFTVNAISYYSMPAHLAASLGFALLVLEERLLLAGVLGSLALALHNPFPHTLVALPFIAFIAWKPGRVRKLATLALGYAPGVAILLGGWVLVRAHFTHPVETRGGLLAGLDVLRHLAFTAPSLDLMVVRTMNLAELGAWAAPLLLPLAVLGAIRCWNTIPARLLAVSAMLTLLGYGFVQFDQGHGWGFRYFHPIWGVLPLFAAGFLESGRASPSLRRLALAAGLGSLALCTPLRFWQVRTFIDSHLAQLPRAEGKQSVVFVDILHGSYTIDLVQNDPFLGGNRWVLISFGDREDRAFMQTYVPGARQTAASAFASAWQVE